MDGWVRLPGILRIAVVTELALGSRKGLLNFFQECFCISSAEETAQSAPRQLEMVVVLLQCPLTEASFHLV